MTQDIKVMIVGFNTSEKLREQINDCIKMIIDGVINEIKESHEGNYGFLETTAYVEISDQNYMFRLGVDTTSLEFAPVIVSEVSDEEMRQGMTNSMTDPEAKSILFRLGSADI